jgi:tetratricopeptide (TPR) repeat protein
MTRNPTQLDIIIQNLKEGNLDSSLEKIRKINITNSNKNLVYKLFASIYFKKKNWENSIKYYQKILSFEEKKFGTYNNIGVALFNLGKINESIKINKKAIVENPNFDLAYNNIGICYNELGAYEEAAKYFSQALTLNDDNYIAKSNLINLFLVVSIEEKNRHPLIKINNKIKNINNKITINSSINLEHVKDILNESDNIIKTYQKEFNYNETQLYRKNSTNLDCKRHFKVFNEFNIIPKYCFACYKIQINLGNVVDLIKLFFIFDNLSLEKNNIRKCITETRNGIPGNYKGYIYCNGIDEAQQIFDKISGIASRTKFEKIKIIIKHGCSEFYVSYPDYKKINVKYGKQMEYNENWKEKELIIDNKTPIRNELDKKKIHKSLKGINLSDILIIKNWICYANLIGDFSYKDIYYKEVKSSFINKILEPQLAFRKKYLLK